MDKFQNSMRRAEAWIKLMVGLGVTASTPIKLAREIVNKLPESLFLSPHNTFFDPCCGNGTFLLAVAERLFVGLQEAIPTEHERIIHIVTRQLYGVDVSQRFVDNTTIALKILTGCKIIRPNIVRADTLTSELPEQLDREFGMNKFNVVLGNPPYQDAVNENTKNIWPLFLKKAFDLTQGGGYVAFVTPRTWTTNELYNEIFLTHQPIYINVDECKRHFVGVGSTFSYYVVKNSTPDHTPFTIIGNDGEFTLTELPEFGLGRTHKDAINILTKVLVGTPKFQMITSSGYNTMKFSKNDPTISKVPTPAHPYKVLHKTKNGIDEFFYSSILDPSEHNVPRVIINIWVANYNKMVVSDTLLTCEQYRHYPTTSLSEAEVLKAVLLSPLYKFIAQSLVSGGSYTHKSLSQFPQVDLTRPWTDAELYKHFNLTPEEIDLIGRTVT